MYTLDCDINELISNKLSDFKISFLNIINNINDDRVVDIIKSYAQIQPIIKFRIIFDILEKFCKDNSLSKDFEILKKYVNDDFDVFNFSNYLRKTDTK